VTFVASYGIAKMCVSKQVSKTLPAPLPSVIGWDAHRAHWAQRLAIHGSFNA